MALPNYQDTVKHKTSAIPVVGVVIAKYPWNNQQYLDVRADDRIYWATPAENWETIQTEEESFE